jgi:hypothetical protein
VRETGKRREDAGSGRKKRDKRKKKDVRNAIPQGKGFRFWAREIAF